MWSGLFGRKKEPVAPPDKGLDRQLLELEAEAQRASGVELQAQVFNRAGDLCARNQQRQKALHYFGRAVDAYLQAAYYDAAVAMCRKIIRFEPGVVRAHCTLAMLAVGNRLLGDAEQEIDAYVHAVHRTGTRHLAIPRLRLMAQATVNARVRRRIAEHLRVLGDESGAEVVFAALERPEESRVDDAQQWERLLRVALTSADKLPETRGQADA
jgi:hypothetical protein